MDKDLNYLAIAQKAGLLVTGEENTGIAIRAGKAKLVMLASDASENAQSRARGFLYGRNTPLIILPRTKAEIAEAVGRSSCSMAALTDTGLAFMIASVLAEVNSDVYGETAGYLAEKKRREAQRKTEAKSHDRNKKMGRRKK